MAFATYNLRGVVTPPANVGYDKTASVVGSLLSSPGAPWGSNLPVTFWPVSSIIAAAAPTGASYTANVTIFSITGSPPASAVAAVAFYTPSSIGTSLSYQSVPTLSTITATVRSGEPSSGTSATTSASPSATSTTGSTSSAASSTSTASTTLAPTSSTSKQYGAGALAGAAVGCAIAGLLLGSLIAFLLFRNKRRNRYQGSGAHTKESSPLQDHGEAVYLSSMPKAAWTSHLPQSDSDNTIRATANTTLDQIEMYIENFYTDKQSGQLGVEAQSALEDFDSRHLPDSVLTMIAASKRPTLLLKHCLSQFILSRVDSHASAGSSFLPKDLTSLQISPQKMSQPGSTQALSQWRVLSRYLRRDPEHDETYLAERDQMISTAARNVCRAFEPWAEGDENKRLRSLIDIMKRASDLGLLLFSQSSSFEWQWKEAGTGDGLSSRKDVTQIVTSPGLYKLSDREGTPLASPLRLLKPRIGSLGG